MSSDLCNQPHAMAPQAGATVFDLIVALVVLNYQKAIITNLSNDVSVVEGAILVPIRSNLGSRRALWLV